MKYVREIEDSIEVRIRWPEPVTFEEMNIEGPNIVLRAAMKVMAGKANKAPKPTQ